MIDDNQPQKNLPDLIPIVGVVMGSWSDWAVMEPAVTVLTELGIPCEFMVVSAHRTPHLVPEYAARAERYGYCAVIAGAGGAAHLPGMLAANLYTIPVIGVPVKTSTLSGVDSLYSIAQMPPGVPVSTMAINGAKNAGLTAAQIACQVAGDWRASLRSYREKQSQEVVDNPNPADDPR